MSQPFRLNPHVLWDVAGIDGLQVMKSLFGEAIDRIAPFQSLETQLDSADCAVLRLCEGNFRLCSTENLGQRLQHTIAHQRAWVKQFPWIASVQTEAITLSELAAIATPRPPFRLSSLASNCAAPVRIEGRSVLVWRRGYGGREILELHTATQDVPLIASVLRQAVVML